MTIEAILGEILTEIKALRTDMAAASTVTQTALGPMVPPPLHGSAALDADAVKLNVLAGPGAAGAPVPVPPPTVVFGGGAAAHAPLPGSAVPPAPVSSAPLPPTPGPASSTVAAPTVTLDSKGLPWDHRIHASSKALIADGTWRAKRGVDPAMVTSVEAELKAAQAAPAAPAPAVAAQPWPFPVEGAAPAAMTFAQLAAVVPGRLVAGTLSQDTLSAACIKHGLPSFPALQHRPDLVPAVAAELGISA